MADAPTPADLAAEAYRKVSRLADEYAHVYSWVGDDTMPKARARLFEAIEEYAALAAATREPEAVAALRELVELKALKDKLAGMVGSPATVPMVNDYNRRKPLAWAAARAALAAPLASQHAPRPADNDWGNQRCDDGGM